MRSGARHTSNVPSHLLDIHLFREVGCLLIPMDHAVAPASGSVVCPCYVHTCSPYLILGVVRSVLVPGLAWLRGHHIRLVDKISANHAVDDDFIF